MSRRREGGAALIVQLDVAGLPLRSREASRQHPPRERARLLGKLRGIGADDCEGHVRHERQFLPHDARQRPESLEMPGPHVRHDGNRRLDDLPIPRNFSRKVGTRLDDECLGIGRRFEDRERHAHEIVQVGAGRMHPEARGEHRAEHFLRARLAVGPRHRDDGPANLPPPLACKAAVCLERVIDLDELDSGHCGRALPHHCRRCPPRESFRQMIMAVEPFAGERHEERTRLERPRVGRDRRETSARWRGLEPECALDEGGRPSRGHRVSSRTMVRSSNGCFSVPTT